MRRGRTAFTPTAPLQYGTSDVVKRFVADTNACWYEIGYGKDSGHALVTAHYRFTVSGTTTGAGAYIPTLPVAASKTEFPIVGTWVGTTWWNYGWDGPVLLNSTGLWLYIHGGGRFMGSSGVHDDTELYINVQYEAAA